MRGTSPWILGKVLYFSCLVFVTIGVFVFRFNAFGDMEPRSDQAFFSWWIQGLYQADHFLPDVGAGESWLNALQRDDGGFLHRLLRIVYSRALSVFNLVMVASRYALTWVLGTTYAAQVVMSLIASASIVLMIGLFPVRARERQPDQKILSDGIAIGITALLLGAVTAYLHIYSPWGGHNFSVLFLVIAVAFGTRVLAAPEDQPRSAWGIAAISYVLAYFAHWANLFLLPAATVLSIIAMPGLALRKRLLISVGFIAFSAALAIPFLIAVFVEESHNLTPNLHSVRGLIGAAFDSGSGELLQHITQRAADWLEKGSQLFSAPGLALGVLGLVVWARRERFLLPLFIVITHFSAWCAMPLFAGTYFRTFFYLTPFLVLGIAYLSVKAGLVIREALKNRTFSIKALAGLAVLGTVTAHVYVQVPILASTEEIRKRVPEVWEIYFAGQGTLKPAMAEVDSILPKDAVVVTWGYGVQFLLRNYEIEGSGRTVAPTLHTMIPRYEDGTLPDHIIRRHLSVPADVPMFALIDHAMDQVDRESVRQGIEDVFGPKGFGIIRKAALEPVGRWRLESSWPGDVALYRVKTD